MITMHGAINRQKLYNLIPLVVREAVGKWIICSIIRSTARIVGIPEMPDKVLDGLFELKLAL
jgi:hypothetical protein